MSPKPRPQLTPCPSRAHGSAARTLPQRPGSSRWTSNLDSRRLSSRQSPGPAATPLAKLLALISWTPSLRRARVSELGNIGIVGLRCDWIIHLFVYGELLTQCGIIAPKFIDQCACSPLLPYSHDHKECEAHHYSGDHSEIPGPLRLP